MKVRITYESEILGKGTHDRFSEGDGMFSDIDNISNLPARECARLALIKQRPVTWGMWTATPIAGN